MIKLKNLLQTNYLLELNNSLILQYKFHESQLNTFEYDSEKETYLESIKKLYNSYFIKNKTIIIESSLIVESFLTVNEQLKKYFNFLSCSFLLEIGLICKNKYKNYINESNLLILENNLNKIWNNTYNVIHENYIWDAWNWVKEKGITTIMDGIRSALDSGVGTAVQAALSFTGVGNIGVAIVWGLMTIYDLYMWLKGGKGPLNFILSVLSAISTGVLAPLLKPFKALKGSITQIFTKLFSSNIGKTLMTWGTKLASGASKLLANIGKGVKFAADYLGIKWLSPLISSASKYIDDVIKTMSIASKQAVTGAKKLAAGTIIKAFGAIGSKKLSNWMLTSAGKLYINKLSIKTINLIQKELVSKLKDYTDEQCYAYIDKTYGKQYGDMLRIANNKKITGVIKTAATISDKTQTKNPAMTGAKAPVG